MQKRSPLGCVIHEDGMTLVFARPCGVIGADSRDCTIRHIRGRVVGEGSGVLGDSGIPYGS